MSMRSLIVALAVLAGMAQAGETRYFDSDGVRLRYIIYEYKIPRLLSISVYSDLLSTDEGLDESRDDRCISSSEKISGEPF